MLKWLDKKTGPKARSLRFIDNHENIIAKIKEIIGENDYNNLKNNLKKISEDLI